MAGGEEDKQRWYIGAQMSTLYALWGLIRDEHAG